jgi:hypothetical protein
VVFIELSDGRWEPDPPDVDQAEEAMSAVAAGEVARSGSSAWLRKRIHFSRIFQRTVRHRPVVRDEAANSRPAEHLRPPPGARPCTMLGRHG